MRRIFWLFPTVGLLCLIALTPPEAAFDDRRLFVERCGQCHAAGKQAPVFTPIKYAGLQWERFFKRNKHKRKQDISEYVTEAEMKKIAEYLIDHASDSDRPEAVGPVRR